jgi:hypothetical protein
MTVTAHYYYYYYYLLLLLLLLLLLRVSQLLSKVLWTSSLPIFPRQIGQKVGNSGNISFAPES